MTGALFPKAVSPAAALRVRRAALLGGSVAFPLLAPLLWPVSPVAALLPSLAAHAALLYGVLRPNVSLLGPVVTRFDPGGRKEVWLTIDDGPDPEDSPHLLELLERAEARATFFLIGRRARACPTAVRAILERGHGIANHSDTHPSAWFWGLPPGRIAQEVDGGNATLAELGGGAAPRLFRAPVGMQNPFLGPALASREMRLIGWSARGFDGVAHRPAEAVGQILRDVRPGAIILLHEGRRGPDGKRLNVLGLKLLLEALCERGYAAVIPDEAQFR